MVEKKMLMCSLCFKTKDDSGDNFFKVPKDKRRRKQWGEICRIDFKKKTAWICKDHFLPSEIIKSGGRQLLIAGAVPFIPPVKEPEKIIEAAYKASSSKNRLSEYREEDPLQITQSSNCVNPPHMHENLMECREQKSTQLKRDSQNINLSKLQENLVMEIPVKKTVFRTRSTQTNTRLCGLVQASEFADDFRLNCFYCSDIFPLEKWEDFITHLKENHFKREKAFETCEYMSEEHDYAPTNLPSKSPLQPVFETIGISPESLLPFLGNEEEPTIPINPTFLYTTAEENLTMPNNINILNNLMVDAGQPVMEKQEHPSNSSEPVAISSPFCYAQEDNLEISLNMSSKNASPAFGLKKVKKSTPFKNKSIKSNQLRNLTKQATRKTDLSRFLRRTIKKETKETEKYNSGLTIIKQQSTPVISFEYSPGAIVDLLLESMSNYPALWQFNTEPFNDDFSKSIASLCKIINNKWSLNIDDLTMRRSVNRILRFYCYLFPNENIENIHPFTCYYDKCAEFLPSSVSEIAYARCSNCYICYKSDFDLKRHLLKEQSFNLRWPYKCVQCKECFKENDDYEFHLRLPHYTEVFRCEPCKKKYFRRNKYNRHIGEYHPKEGKERRFKCDECDKAYTTMGCLKVHKIYHGERNFKCHLCSKSYHENAKLQIHLKTHRKEYDFICEVCAKEFITQSALNVHMDKHTGDKITCNLCNLKLRKSSLSRHMRLLHTPGDANAPKRVRMKSKGKIRNYKSLLRTKPFVRRKECERRKYKCKVCTLIFEKYKELAEHNKEMHSDLPKWPCQLCTTVFSMKLNLKRHYRRKHDLHVIQVYKLLEEGEDLSDVLSIATDELDYLAEKGTCSTRSALKEKKKDTQAPVVKSEFISDEDSIEENLHSFQIQEEIIRAADNITKEEIKINYMNEYFADI